MQMSLFAAKGRDTGASCCLALLAAPTMSQDVNAPPPSNHLLGDHLKSCMYVLWKRDSLYVKCVSSFFIPLGVYTVCPGLNIFIIVLFVCFLSIYFCPSMSLCANSHVRVSAC